MNEKKTTEINLAQCLRILWKKAYWIVACALILALVGLVYTAQFVTPTYKTDVKLYVNTISYATDKDGNTVEQYNPSTNLGSARDMVASYVEILRSNSTLEAVIAKAGLQGVSAEALKSMISAGALNETEILQVTITDTDPVRAKVIADTITEVLPSCVQNVMKGTEVTIVDTAKEAQANSVGYFKNVFAGGLLGAVLCVVIILAKAFSNPLITDEENIEALYGLPILAVIPDLCRANEMKSMYGGHAYKGQDSQHAS